MSFKQAFDQLATRAEQAAKGKQEHLEADGLLHCDVCGEPTQTRIIIFDEERTVRCICRCDREQREREEKARQREQQLLRIQKLRIQGFDKAEMQGWTFENDDGKQPNVTKAAKAYCERFDEFKARGKGLVFHGNVGTGKTYTAACIANELISKGVPVLMTNFTRIINRLQDKFEGRQEYLDSLNAFDLLIIDDLAAERNTDYVNEAVYSVIDGRYRSGLPLIITTNVSLKEMTDAAEIARKRIYSRLLERCHPIQVAGEDRRKQALFDDYAEMNRLLGL